MNKLLMMIAVALGLMLGSTVSASDGWLTDITKAKADAKMGKKIILVEFSGSDWCGPCILINKSVFSTAEFKKFAKDNLVLLLADFPNNKKNQSADLQKRNIALAKKYNIKGFPTILLLDYDGKVIARTVGYQPGSAADYIKQLKGLMKKK